MKKTALYDLHVELGARFVDFAGYTMPLQYSGGLRAEHLHTRTRAGLFDVSHMGQLRLSGENIGEALETLVTGDVTAMKPFRQRYTMLTNERGGIIDDLMLTRTPDALLLVVNAARKEADQAYLRDALGAEYRVEMLTDRALLALQGPQAAKALGKLHPDCGEQPFLAARALELGGIPCLVSRCGYTGEDGFEISVPSGQARRLAELLLEDRSVAFIGLGARDSLRLEAGLCLYGHDIDETTSPVEAGLSWVIAKKYRDGAARAGFPGADTILRQLREGAGRVRRGLRAQGRIPVRGGTILLNNEQQEIGRVTSGGFGPSANHPVAMGYVEREYAEAGAELQAEIRRRFHSLRVVDLPFVQHRYYRA